MALIWSLHRDIHEGVGVVIAIWRRDFVMFAFRALGYGHVRGGTSDTALGLKHADLFLQLLNIGYCFLEDFELKLFFLSLLTPVGRKLLSRSRSELVFVFVVVIRTLVVGYRGFPSCVCRHEVSQH